MRNTQLRDALTGVVPDGKETASARAGKLRPFHKVPRERDIDTSLMWVIEPSIPNKMYFRRTLQFVVIRHRALAKKTDIEKVPLDVNDVIREVMALVQLELINHRVSLRIDLAPALPTILGDRVQLEQVVIDLAMNGVEAMRSVTDRPRELVIRSGQDETQQVLVSVTDCGVGISAENADRLFNAFFTTKATGMGTGLSICRSIVEAHDGRLWATANVPTVPRFSSPSR
jgi:signal transduction histidine kinase